MHQFTRSRREGSGRLRARAHALVVSGAAAMTVLFPLTAQADPERGGTLEVASLIDISSLDPLFGSAISVDRSKLNLFYENLFYLDENGKMSPRLAKSWTTAEGGMSMTFELEEGVTFHDGTPFDAAAVKANIDRLIGDREASRATKMASMIAGAEILGDHTVRIDFNRPSGAVISTLASEAGMMVSPAAMDDPEALRRNPVGTGPFVLDDWQGGFELSAVRNPDYWRDGEDGEALPYLDGVDIRFLTDTSVMIAEAQAGALHVTDTLQVKDFDRVEADPELELNPRRLEISQFLAINNTRGPLAENQELREAISAAIDRGQMERVISKGFGRVNPTWVASTDQAFDGSLEPQATDKDLARSLYESNAPDQPLKLSVIGRDPDTQIAQIVQAQLSEAGIPLEIEVLEREAWLEKTRGAQHDLAMLRSQPLADPDMRFSGYYAPGSTGNYSALNVPELDAMVKDAEATLDVDERRRKYSDIQQMLLDNTYEVYLFARPAAEAIRVEVEDLGIESVGSFQYGETYLDRDES